MRNIVLVLLIFISSLASQTRIERVSAGKGLAWFNTDDVRNWQGRDVFVNAQGTRSIDGLRLCATHWSMHAPVSFSIPCLGQVPAFLIQPDIITGRRMQDKEDYVFSFGNVHRLMPKGTVVYLQVCQATMVRCRQEWFVTPVLKITW